MRRETEEVEEVNRLRNDVTGLAAGARRMAGSEIRRRGDKMASSQVPGDEEAGGATVGESGIGTYGSLTPGRTDIMETGRITRRAGAGMEMLAAREMESAGRLLMASDPKLAAGIMEEAKALKLKALVMDFFDDVKEFRKHANMFVDELGTSVRDAKALARWPELAEILRFVHEVRKGIPRAFLIPEGEVQRKLLEVVEADRGVPA